MKRVFTALLLTPCVVGVMLAAPPAVFGALVALLACAAIREFHTIAEHYEIRALTVPSYAAVLLLVLLPTLDKSLFLMVLTPALLVAGFYRYGDPQKYLPSAAMTMAGILYIAAPLLWGRLVHRINPYWLLFVIVVNAVGDTAALYIGRSLGKHPLAPHVSPHKTWEGTIASVVFSMLAGTVYAHFLLASDLSLTQAPVLALALNIAGQLGDLAESALKRGAGLKDSGKSLPGHGGVLDRLDAFLFSIPLMYGYLRYL